MAKAIAKPAISAEQKQKNKKQLRIQIKRHWMLYLFLLPCIVWLLVFCYAPMAGIVLAFKNYRFDLGIFGSEWAGLKHFRKFVTSPEFWMTIKNTLVITSLKLVVCFPAPIILALLLNEVKAERFKKTVQTISYLPHFISTVSIVGILFMVLSPNGGIVNIIIQKLGGTPIYFMTESKWFRTIYVASGVWQNLGWDAIIYIAALAGVNQELYEAAVIDGASRLKQIWHVSLPGIRSTIVVMLIMRMGGMMSSNTDKVLLMQNALTYEVSDIMGTYVYRRGIQDADYSYSTAVGLFNSLINVVFVVTANTISKRLGESSLW